MPDWKEMKLPVTDPAIKTCFVSRFAFQFEFNILGNMKKREGNMKNIHMK